MINSNLRMMSKKIYTVKVKEIADIAPSVRSIKLAFPKGEEFTFQAGQFVKIRTPKEAGEIKEPFSIASSPFENGSVEICIRRVKGGRISNFIHQLSGGEALTLEGPFGRFVIDHPQESDIVFVATGTGIAPIRSMVSTLFRQRIRREVWLLFGVRHKNEILYREEFEQLQNKFPNFHFIPTVSKPDRWDGEIGYVQDKLPTHIKNLTEKEFYVCGLHQMVNEVKNILLESGVPKDRIHGEQPP